MGYRNGPTAQDVQLAEPADLKDVQTGPVEHTPPALSSLGDCRAMVRPLQEPQEPPMEVEATCPVEDQPEGVFVQGDDVEMRCCEPVEANQEKKRVEIICTPVEVSDCEVGPTLASEEEIHQGEPTVAFEEEVGEDILQPSSLETLKEQGPPLPQQPCVSDCSPNAIVQAEVAVVDEEDHKEICATVESPTCSQSPTSSYWSLELLIAAAFCGDCPPPSPPVSYQSQGSCVPLNSSCHGMELLSELADLELQRYHQSCSKTPGMFHVRTCLEMTRQTKVYSDAFNISHVIRV